MTSPPTRPRAPMERHLEAVHRASTQLRALLRPADMAQALIGVLEDVLDYEHAAVLLVDPTSGDLVPFALSDQGQGAGFIEEDKEFVRLKRPRIGAGITGWVAEHGQSVLAGDIRDDPRFLAVRAAIRSELCVPIRAGSNVLGVLNVESTRPDAYDDADRMVLETVAGHFAVAYVAVMDSLTAVCNRACVELVGAREVERAIRFGRPASALLIDVDRFKQINDSLGHAAGDQVLRFVATQVDSCLRDADVLGRYGGDELVAVLVEADEAAAAAVVRRIEERLAGHPLEIGDTALRIEVSIGAATISKRHAGFGALLADADQAMYLRKRGRAAASPGPA